MSILKGILGAVAPVLASALPGPLGGMARKVLGDVLGKPDPPDAEIEKALAAANPELLVKLKAADQAFQLQMEQLGIDLEKIAAEDRASARAMQVATRARAPAVLAAVMVGGWIALVSYLAFKEVPISNRDIIVAAVGVFSAQLVTIYQFYFGSSASSQRKDDTISKLS